MKKDTDKEMDYLINHVKKDMKTRFKEDEGVERPVFMPADALIREHMKKNTAPLEERKRFPWWTLLAGGLLVLTVVYVLGSMDAQVQHERELGVYRAGFVDGVNATEICFSLAVQQNVSYVGCQDAAFAYFENQSIMRGVF